MHAIAGSSLAAQAALNARKRDYQRGKLPAIN